MIYLILSVLSSALIYVVFKMFGKRDVNTFPAIVVNYIVCVAIGATISGKAALAHAAILSTGFYGIAILLGVLFIMVFYFMAMTTRHFGVAAASIVSRMSLIIPVIVSVWLYAEDVTATKVIGIIIGLASIALILYKPKKIRIAEGIAGGAAIIAFPIIAFFGSGIIDSLIKIAEVDFIKDLPHAIFVLLLFGSACICGLAVLGGLAAFKGIKLGKKEWVWGAALGVANYFSIYFFLLALKAGFEGSVVFPVNHISIVALSMFIAVVFFKEHLNKWNVGGFALALVAIALITYATWHTMI